MRSRPSAAHCLLEIWLIEFNFFRVLEQSPSWVRKTVDSDSGAIRFRFGRDASRVRARFERVFPFWARVISEIGFLRAILRAMYVSTNSVHSVGSQATGECAAVRLSRRAVNSKQNKSGQGRATFFVELAECCRVKNLSTIRFIS